uniref:Uncharacterized protein n=1 Tax=Anopheles minimus TaxID=112268 RepID=A0A182WPB6_9DIPT
MAFKCCILFALVAAASAAVLPVAVKHIEYPDTPAEYQFEYSVHDDHTGDIKSQHEEHRYEHAYRNTCYCLHKIHLNHELLKIY